MTWRSTTEISGQGNLRPFGRTLSSSRQTALGGLILSSRGALAFALKCTGSACLGDARVCHLCCPCAYTIFRITPVLSNHSRESRHAALVETVIGLDSMIHLMTFPILHLPRSHIHNGEPRFRTKPLPLLAATTPVYHINVL